MKKFLKNEKGSVLLMATAIIVCVVSAISAVSLLGMVRNGQLQTQYDHDAIQQELLLRSESVRGHLALEHNNSLWPPPRNIQINQHDRKTYYEIQSKTENTYVSLLAGQPIELAVAVKSKITCKRGTYNHWLYESPVVRLSERLVKSQSLAQYQYFTDTDASENEDGGMAAAMVKFWGPDVLWGPVHSNHDIYLQNAGGGSNNNWPTFHAKVSTAEHFRLFPGGGLAVGNCPMEQIFLGGWQEEAGEIQFDPDPGKISMNGSQIGLGADIVYVKMHGSSAEIQIGHKNFLGTRNFDVYSWYPKDADEANWCIDNGGNWYEDSDLIWTNEVAVYDTTWSPGGTISWVSEASYWVPDGELWIEGDVSGKVTWGCADTIFITDDIYYTHTDKGQPPDDPDEMNPSDFFGLVSGKSILVRYKHKDPFEEGYPIVAPNCDGHVYLYGAYAAMGAGDPSYGIMACHGDGIFTFQYQHGHGSTPNFRAPSPYWPHDDTLYTYIDLHKFVFPQNPYLPNNKLGFNLHGGPPPPGYPTCGFLYESPAYIISFPNNNPTNYVFPYGTDFPWYNPIWPEPATTIIFERGTIHMWGAIAQRRRGFIHRSGGDDYNHPPGDNRWVLEPYVSYKYDGEHGSSGYVTKDYHYDDRLMYVQPPNFPEVYKGWGESAIAAFDKQAWVYKSPKEW
ncbi:MAG: hypothetical protein Q7J16_13305 [Candidatus Cloacimonadales bacterium]|nr:hypothetical protein [Candidatus Cloacimonadales bacterium]